MPECHTNHLFTAPPPSFLLHFHCHTLSTNLIDDQCCLTCLIVSEGVLVCSVLVSDDLEWSDDLVRKPSLREKSEERAVRGSSRSTNSDSLSSYRQTDL